MLRLKEKYQKEVIPEMMKRFGYKNKMAVPKLKKVVVNVGFGKMVTGLDRGEIKKVCDEIKESLALITGQTPILTKARKSIAGFKIRKGAIIGAKVTLRRQKMYDFLDRLIHIALPRTRDFRGIKLSSVDRNGNLTIGIKENIVFPEASQESLKKMFGMEITIVNDAKTREEAIELYRLLGFPLRDKN